MTTLSTHVLNTSTGEPAVGLQVRLSHRRDDGWVTIADGVTDAAGRLDLGVVETGTHRLGFETGEYGSDFYPFIHVVFEVDDGRDHYHIPLLLSPFGYTTYRGG